MKNYLPSLRALVADDDLLREELRCLAVRQQAAVVRGLVDQVECLGPSRANCALRAQLVEELARLGCRILEAAAALSETTPPEPQSGILPIGSADAAGAS